MRNTIWLLFLIASIQVQTYPTLRVLVATDIFPRLPQRYVVNHIIGLMQDGHEVTIYAQQMGDTTMVHHEVTTYNLLKKLYIKSLPPDIEEYDCILCQHGYVGVELLKLKKIHNLKAKLITFFHGYEIWGFADQHPEYYNELFQEGDYFLTNCNVFKKRAIELGCPPHLISVNYTSIDLSTIPYIERTPDFTKKINILTTGRLGYKKGISDALDAIAILAKKYPHLHYTIAGDGPLQKKLYKKAKKLGISKRVSFTGRYTSTELPHLLGKADIFLAPSVTPKHNDKDALINTIKEAMASGLPIVSTYHGGIPEFIIHGENGLLVEERDSKGLAQQIEHIIKNPKLVYEFGRKGRELVQRNFEKDKLNSQLIDIIWSITK